MPVALKRPVDAAKPAARIGPMMHLVHFAAAGPIVSILLLTYGLDLSPGLL